MKRFGLLAVLLFASCAGMNVRDGGLSTISASFNNVIAPIAIVAIGAEQDAGNITAVRAEELRGYVVTIGQVLEGNGMPITAATTWDKLRPFVEDAIDQRVARGEIGPGVGASLKEVLRMFAGRLLDVSGPVAVADVPGIELTGAQWDAVEASTR